MRTQLPGDILELIELQDGVISARQALEAGLSRGAVSSKLRSGRWQQMYRGVYATFSGEPGRPAALWAGVLSAGPGAMLSYRSAAELGRLADAPSDLIHVTVPGDRRVAKVPGIVLHYSARAGQALHPALLPPQTRIEETILDLMNAATALDTALAWVAAGLGRRLTTQAKLRAATELRGRLRWRPELAELLTDDSTGLNSILEVRYHRDVERPHGLPNATRQAPGWQDGRHQYRDVLYKAYRTAIELDGRLAHPGDTRWKDIRRDNAAALDGLTTLRYGWFDVTQTPCRVAAEIAMVLAGRGFTGARRCSPRCLVAPVVQQSRSSA
jgi:hypothetical protein